MDFFDDSIQVLKRNKSRTILTGLAMAAGVFILMIAMAGFNIFRNGNLGKLATFDEEIIFFVSLPTTKPYGGFSSGREWKPKADQIADIKQEYGNVLNSIGPVYSFPSDKLVQLSNGKRDKTHVVATYPESKTALSLSNVHGRYVGQMDMDGQAKVCVVGRRMADKWFGKGCNPCGEKILLDGVSFTIVGVIKKDNEMALQFGNEENMILIPYTTADVVYNLDGKVTQLMFGIPAEEGYKQITSRIGRYIRSLNNVDPEDTDACWMESLQSYAIMVATVFDGINILFWVVFMGVIITSLLGVFGIMMLSVKERKAEIGIRLTMGAVPEDVEKQFVCESLIVTIVSTVVGLLLSEIIIVAIRKVFAAGLVTNVLFGAPQIPLVGTILVIVLIIAGGILAGYLPSRQMSNMKISELFSE